MSDTSIALIFFVYGLAFFSMGLTITLEAGRGSDVRLRHALRPLAGKALSAAILATISPARQRKKITRFMDSMAYAPVAQLLWDTMSLSKFEGMLPLMLISSRCSLPHPVPISFWHRRFPSPFWGI